MIMPGNEPTEIEAAQRSTSSAPAKSRKQVRSGVAAGVSGTDNIFLIGPMGAGKSTIGRHLAQLLGKKFQDTDHEIEMRTGANIALIFEIEGEDGFRRRESAVIEELTKNSNIVLATGGGAVLSETNRNALCERGWVVYLHAPIDILVQRTHRDRNRPLLQTADRRKTLEELMRVREPIYRQAANVVINTDRRSPRTVAREIVSKLNDWQSRENA
jgi:shikimate kinase